jgi:hypothetical protein
VLDLDFGAVTKWWEGDWDIGKGVADLIVDALIDDGSFTSSSARSSKRS